MKKGLVNIFAVAVIMAVAFATLVQAAPIRGLVDIATGIEVPDADARYLIKGVTNSLGWFDELYVETSATAGNEVVNWTTMTNYVAGTGSDTQAVWGAISGTLSDQGDLNTELTNRYTKAEADTLFAETGSYNIFNSSNKFNVATIINAKLYFEDGAGGSRFYIDNFNGRIMNTYWDQSYIDFAGGILETDSVAFTTWTVEGTAVSGLDIVNYQSMTNWVTLNAGDVVAANYNEFTSSNRMNGSLYMGPSATIYAGGDGLGIVWEQGSGAQDYYESGKVRRYGTQWFAGDVDMGDVTTYNEFSAASNRFYRPVYLDGAAYAAVDATAGTEVVNWQTMTNWVIDTALSDVAFKSLYNEFTSSNRFSGRMFIGDHVRSDGSNLWNIGTTANPFSTISANTFNAVGSEYQINSVPIAFTNGAGDIVLQAAIVEIVNGGVTSTPVVATDLFAGIGTTGVVTAAANDVGRFLNADGSFDDVSIGGAFTMTSGVTNQIVAYGKTYASAPYPIVTMGSDATFMAVPEVIARTTTNFTFRMRGASDFVTNAWEVLWNASP